MKPDRWAPAAGIKLEPNAEIACGVPELGH
jgi:hypothetical protein